MTQTARPIKVGLFIPFLERMMDNETPRWADLAIFAREAEAVGFDSLWVADHLLWHNGLPGYEPEDLGPWEC
jgi:alkanesulfonate monooxygenase SsuD/methylene tetrahydromethanopterin reductase-like flavin-dependent oxidoreductase (luciferase family)